VRRRGAQGLNYDEVVVYEDAAMAPAYVVVYQLPGTGPAAPVPTSPPPAAAAPPAAAPPAAAPQAAAAGGGAAPAATAATDLVFCAAEWAANQAAGKFDDQGVLFHIGTEGGASAWSNPHEAGRVVVSWSSVRDSDSDIQNFVSFNRMGCKGTESCTSGSAGSGQWMMVDLGAGRTLTVNHYALRSGHYASTTVRNWELQGAAAGAGPWTTLRSHSADSSLEAAPWSVAAWPVAAQLSATSPWGWRCFRIRATGPNESGGDRLDCGGIELYGSLREGAAGAGAAPAASLRTNVPDLQDPNITLTKVMQALQAPTTKAVRTHGSRAVQTMLDDVSVATEMNCFMDPSSPPLVVLIAGEKPNVITTAGYVVQAWNRAASRAGVTGLNKNWYISNHKFAVSMVDVHTEVAQGTLPDGCRG
jgi:hypothetical protein